ncbi:supporter of activation of yellow protein [Eurosta solidaginis]|uniref:supporter of activation of yellow protein n=1 Tax=Eurosta solidaginis TaxID=178769 RepID=UPI0035314E7C
MNDRNNQQYEESLNIAQNISCANRRTTRNHHAALAQAHVNLLRAAEDQEQIVTSTSSDAYTNNAGQLPLLESLITSPARITSSTGNDCSSSPQRLLSTTCSSSNSSGESGRQSNQNRGDITTTDASSEDESQSPHQTATQSFLVGRSVLKLGGVARTFTQSAHVLDSLMPTTSAAATRTAGVRKVEAKVASNINTNSGSISNLSNGILEYMQENGSGSRNMVAREQTVAVASSGDASADHAENVGTTSGQTQTATAEQTAESHKIILKLPKPNANARPNESQSNAEPLASDSFGGGSSSHSGVETTRKVEPLKINLNTHNPTNIVPKITIKPIIKKPNEPASSDCSSSAEDDMATGLCSTRSGAQIVKRNDEPHIVPKLTIRSANDSSDSSIVPRLTIKMSDGQCSQLSPSAIQANSTAKQHSPPPLPKLTIKTALDGTSESIMSTISPASSSSSSSSTSSSVGVLCLSSLSASCTVSNSTCASVVPKLTIKTLTPKHDELVPKLTIKTSATGACIASSATAAAAEGSIEANDSGNTAGSSSKIPKLTIKTGQEHAVIITQHNDSSNAQVIPKLTIKTKSLDVEESLSDLSEDPPLEKIPRITIKTHETAAEITTPKFCIKTLQQQSEPEHAHVIPKLTISMSNLEGAAAPQSPKQPPLVVRQLSSNSTRKPESPERLPKLMISRQDTLGNNSDASAEKTVPKLTIKTNSQDNSGGKECQEKIPKLTIKSIPNVEQHSSEESDECLSGESSPPMSAVEETASNKVVPKLTIKNLSSPTLKMKAVLEDKTQRSASKKCGKSTDPKGIGDKNAGTAIHVMPQQQLGPGIEHSAREQMINGCESSSSQEFCGFNNDNTSIVQLEDEEEVEDIQEPRRNSDDMDIDEGLQQHDPQVFNNVFHVSNGQNDDDTQPIQAPLPADDLSNVVDTVDLTSSPSPGSSPVHFNYTDADPQISDAQRPPQATILMERLQRELSVIQTAPSMENTNSFLLNQLNSLSANKYGGPPPLHPKPAQQHGNHDQLELQKQQQQQQQQISNSMKYPQLTERLMANGARIPRNSTITCSSNSLAPMSNANVNVNMISHANQPEKVIDSIEILDTPEGSPRLTLDDTAAMPENLHINNEDGLNNPAASGVYGDNSADILRRNNNTMEDSSAATDSINSISLKRHGRAMSTLIMENDVAEQCIEITPNKVRRIDSESHTMATLTILTDDESSNTKLITTSPTIFSGNHHVVDITNDVASSDNVPITMELSSPKTSNHHSRKQRHENLLAIPLDEENSLQYMNYDDAADIPVMAQNEHSNATKAAASAQPLEQLTTSTPVVKRRGRPKKNPSNNLATSAVVQTPSEEADTAGGTADEVARRVELLRKRLAIDMVATESPAEELESTDVVNETEVSKSERALRTGARSSRRSVLPVAAITPVAKNKPVANNGEIATKKNKRPVSTLGTSENVAVSNTKTINPTGLMSGAAVPVLNHCGGSNSSLSSAYSSSSISSATVTTATGSQPSTGVSASISLSTQIDLTMCSSSSSTSNGSTTATMTIAGVRSSVTTGAINVAVQNQSSSSMLPPATILSSSDPVPDMVFRPNDFSSIMATQQLRAPHANMNIETDLLRMQTTIFNSNRLDGRDEKCASESAGANGSGPDMSGDESTTSSMSTPVGRGRGGRGRGRGRARGSRAHSLGRGAGNVAKQIALTRPRCVGGLKHTPDPERMKGLFSPSPQVFEEDTRMSADLSQTQLQLPAEPATPLRQPDFLNNDESQSSVISTSSILDPNNVVAVQNGSAVKRTKKKKMEVCIAEDAEITVSAIAEYEWPPPKGCCPARDRDTFMIQEQVALYLGIKSFKRKYPDLPRRQIDMEERNWLQEKGLVSERMCDLGITAVWASDILDIMYADFYEKYEEYKDFIRQKHLREIEAKQKALGLNVTGRGLQVRDRAMLSTSKWNAYFNRSRKEERLACMDLQTLTVNVPLPATAPTATLVNRPIADAVAEAIKAEQIPEPPTLLKPRITTPPHNLDASYPVAVVTGQYSAKYHHYTPLDLSCLPLNTVLIDPRLLAKRISQHTLELPESKVLDEKPVMDHNTTSVARLDTNHTEIAKRRNRHTRKAAMAKPKPVDNSETESAMSSSDNGSESETDSDSDTDSSTDDSSSSSEEESDAPDTCGVCQRTQNCNMKDLPEVFIRCYTCRRKVHPSCVEMPHRMVARVRNYNWQCFDCKCCIKCKGKKDQNKMLYCEQCDRGFHIYCLGVKAVPDGRWSCDRCSICMRCGATKPEGLPQPTSLNGEKIKPIKHKKVKWIHEYRIDHITKLREHCSMLCVPCGRPKNMRRVQIASPGASNNTTSLPSPPATTQQKQPVKSRSQSHQATAAATNASDAAALATATADGTARASGKSSKNTSTANATKTSSTAGTLPPPPPPVVA